MCFQGTHILLFRKYDTRSVLLRCAFLPLQSFFGSNQGLTPALLPILRQIYNASRNHTPGQEHFFPQEGGREVLTCATLRQSLTHFCCGHFRIFLKKIYIIIFVIHYLFILHIVGVRHFVTLNSKNHLGIRASNEVSILFYPSRKGIWQRHILLQE